MKSSILFQIYHTVCMSKCPKGYTNYEDDEGHWLINLNQKKKEKDNFCSWFYEKKKFWILFFGDLKKERTRF